MFEVVRVMGVSECVCLVCIVCVRVGVRTVCVRAKVFTMSMNVSCKSRLFVCGMMGSMMSASRGSRGETVVQSMSGRLKSPEIHMCLLGPRRESDVCRCCRYSVLEEGGL